jgi:hypothetical protein
VRAVEVGQSPKTPQEQGHVGTQDAMVVVTFIDDDERQPTHEP